MASQPGDGRDEAQYRCVAVVSVGGMLMKSISRTNGNISTVRVQLLSFLVSHGM